MQKLDHDYAANLEKMEDSRYCKPGKRFDNAVCQKCKVPRKFVLKKVNAEDIQPSVKTPIHCCQNWSKHCQYAICNQCFFDKTFVERR